MQRFFQQYKALFITAIPVLLAITLIAMVITQVKTNDIVKQQTVEIEQNQATIKEQGKQIETLQQQLKKADTVISDMEAEKKKLKGDLDSLEDENGRLQKEILDLKKKISIAEEKSKDRVTVLSSRSSSSGRTLTVEASAYTAMCSEGCTGKTATGIDIRNRTPKIIAVDPKVIPLGTVVEMFVDGESWGQYTAADKGGVIKGHKIDVLMKTEKQANNFGRRQVELKIVGKTKLNAV